MNIYGGRGVVKPGNVLNKFEEEQEAKRLQRLAQVKGIVQTRPPRPLSARGTTPCPSARLTSDAGSGDGSMPPSQCPSPNLVLKHPRPRSASPRHLQSLDHYPRPLASARAGRAVSTPDLRTPRTPALVSENGDARKGRASHASCSPSPQRPNGKCHGTPPGKPRPGNRGSARTVAHQPVTHVPTPVRNRAAAGVSPCAPPLGVEVNASAEQSQENTLPTSLAAGKDGIVVEDPASVVPERPDHITSVVASGADKPSGEPGAFTSAQAIQDWLLNANKRLNAAFAPSGDAEAPEAAEPTKVDIPVSSPRPEANVCSETSSKSDSLGIIRAPDMAARLDDKAVATSHDAARAAPTSQIEEHAATVSVPTAQAPASTSSTPKASTPPESYIPSAPPVPEMASTSPVSPERADAEEVPLNASVTLHSSGSSSSSSSRSHTSRSTRSASNNTSRSVSQSHSRSIAKSALDGSVMSRTGKSLGESRRSGKKLGDTCGSYEEDFDDFEDEADASEEADAASDVSGNSSAS